MNDMSAVRELIGSADPALDVEPPLPLHSAKEIIGSHRRGRAQVRGGSKLGVATAAAVAALITGTWVIWSTSVYASPPAPLLQVATAAAGSSAREQLLALAAAAEADTSSSTHGRYAYVATRGWYLDSSVDGSNVDTALFESTNETWVAADGSGRDKRSRAVSDRVNLSVRQKMSALMADLRTNTSDKIIATGEAGGTWSPPSNDRAVLEKQLWDGHPKELGSAELMVAVADMNHAWPLSAEQRSAVLRVLADARDIQFVGETTDRSGRRGQLFAVDTRSFGPLTRVELVFDSAGNLLDEEHVFLERPTAIDVAVPAVAAYTLFESSGWVDTVTARPKHPSQSGS